MAELSQKERLLPSLLDRLTDHEPHRHDELRDQRVGTVKSLRESVLRDLGWLMNTVNLASVIDLDDYPELASTVINYGLPGLSGHTSRDAELVQVEKLIKAAIQAFEPRILKGTLRVRFLAEAELKNRHAVAFQIEGMLWGRPMPEALFLHTELDLELGEVHVREA